MHLFIAKASHVLADEIFEEPVNAVAPGVPEDHAGRVLLYVIEIEPLGQHAMIVKFHCRRVLFSEMKAGHGQAYAQKSPARVRRGCGDVWAGGV